MNKFRSVSLLKATTIKKQIVNGNVYKCTRYVTSLNHQFVISKWQWQLKKKIKNYMMLFKDAWQAWKRLTLTWSWLNTTNVFSTFIVCTKWSSEQIMAKLTYLWIFHTIDTKGKNLILIGEVTGRQSTERREVTSTRTFLVRAGLGLNGQQMLT